VWLRANCPLLGQRAPSSLRGIRSPPRDDPLVPAENHKPAPNYQFHWFDIKAPYGRIDGHLGSIEAGSFRFPFREDEFDTCLASSVFTHMPLSEVNHYLGELHRVVRHGGKVFLSIFCSRKAPYSRDGNYCHSRETFIATVEQRGFLWDKKGPEVYGEEHNWYLLTRPHRH